MANLEDRLTLAAFNSLGNEPGTVKLVWGSYVGNGQSAPGAERTLTFDGKPLFIMIFPTYEEGENRLTRYYCGQITAKSYPDASSNTVATIWTDDSFTFRQLNSSLSADTLRNISGRTYYYLALVAV